MVALCGVSYVCVPRRARTGSVSKGGGGQARARGLTRAVSPRIPPRVALASANLRSVAAAAAARPAAAQGAASRPAGPRVHPRPASSAHPAAGCLAAAGLAVAQSNCRRARVGAPGGCCCLPTSGYPPRRRRFQQRSPRPPVAIVRRRARWQAILPSLGRCQSPRPGLHLS